MKGDFTRNTFDQFRHFSRVLMQQGRVQLDADFNEQTEILLHYLRTAIRDIIGPYGGPAEEWGFEIKRGKEEEKFIMLIGKGRYYVDGILCENLNEVDYDGQEGFEKEQGPLESKNYYVYLDVWERHVTCVQDDRIREVAIGGADTCTRSKIVCQVKIKELDEGLEDTCNALIYWLKGLRSGDSLMRARVSPEQREHDVCSIPPESKYRGPENQLYRIEVHRGLSDEAGSPTFKWSRDNGSIVFPIVRQKGAVVTLQSLGRDERRSLRVGDWVEIMDDDHELLGKPGILAEVDQVDLVEMKVVLKPPADIDTSRINWPFYDETGKNHPLLRRWDHRLKEGLTLSGGAILITESNDPESGWIEIENGIEVQFQPSSDAAAPISYQTGDYWLVPARVATGLIDWPADTPDSPLFTKPHGVIHHYAPLAILRDGTPHDCRCEIDPMCASGRQI